MNVFGVRDVVNSSKYGELCLRRRRFMTSALQTLSVQFVRNVLLITLAASMHEPISRTILHIRMIEKPEK
jgi:hypothetical protein